VLATVLRVIRWKDNGLNAEQLGPAAGTPRRDDR